MGVYKRTGKKGITWGIAYYAEGVRVRRGVGSKAGAKRRGRWNPP
jgi:hypothetical protein